MVGVDAVDRKRCGLHVRAFEWFDVIAKSFASRERTVFLRVDEDGGYFQQRIGLAIEATGFNIDGNRKKTAKPFSD